MTEFRNASILLPAMDETYSLRETLETIVRTNAREDLAEFLILLCDRTSEDTRAVAEKLNAEYGETIPVRIHDQSLPFVGGAIREGIDLAKGTHVVMMSSDLETPPEVVKDLIARAKASPDRIITASRWIGSGGFSGYSRIKLICNWIFEHGIALLYGVRLTDMTYAYRIFPTGLMKSIRWEELRHPFFLETAVKPLRLGVGFEEVPAKWTARTEGVSQNGFWANFRYFKTAWHNRFLPCGKIRKADG